MSTARHPLDLLEPSEVAASAQLLADRGVVGPDTSFHRVAIHEPGADAPGSPTAPRRIESVLWHRDRRMLEEVVVDLAAGEVVSRVEVPAAFPIPGLREMADAAIAALRHPEVVAALAQRGVTDLEQVQVDSWPTGQFGLPFEAGRRVLRCLFYFRERPGDNGYSRPIDGLAAHVDLDEGVVVHVDDLGVWPIPPEPVNYDAASVGPLRDDLRPIEITQPDGPSFVIDGNEIAWQRWRFRVWLDPTEGPVLHSVRHLVGDEERSIIRRASLAEMVVPYGETRPTHAFKNAMDVGELGLGRLANSLRLGCDCLGEIAYLDATFSRDDGAPVVVANAICIHEEDFGIGWKHHDVHTGTTEVRRSRRLVVSSVHTAGNYEYGFFWHLYLDGTIELQVKLTGIVSPMAVRDGDDLTRAPLLAPGLAGPVHQHWFCCRLEMAVDGEANSVYEVDVTADDPDLGSPFANAFSAKATRLEGAAGARRDAAPARSRTWKVVNERRRNRVGQPTAYTLVPGPHPDFLPSPSSMIAGRAGFVRHQLWVTPTRPTWRFPAGTYVSQSMPDGQGLPRWSAADEPIVDTAITLWHTFGVTHVPRPEDFPVMPVEYVGFQLHPFGFFDRNPALDVPPSGADHCGATG